MRIQTGVCVLFAKGRLHFAKASLHGTAASLNQHPKRYSVGLPRKKIELKIDDSRLKDLPDWYLDIQPFHLRDDILLESNTNTIPCVTVDEKILAEDLEWLEDESMTSWGVYHARKCTAVESVASSAMLPIWRDDSKSPATIKHVIDVLMNSTSFLNPGQTAVIGMDQPLYAIAKKIQWEKPDFYGEKKLILMLGSLHIEMVFLSCLGDWLEGSGWLTALSNAGVTGPGNDSLCTGHSVAKSKYAHQVTVKVLYALMKNAYQDSSSELGFEDWRAQMESSSPLFQYWSIVLRMEQVYLLFMRSIRTASFDLYVYSLEKLLPWIFALDHHHYARWLSVHHYDMQMLQTTNPDIYEEFKVNGNFTVKRTKNPGSAMGLDQRHEQLNKDVKGNMQFFLCIRIIKI